MTKIQTYNYNGFSFFSCYSPENGEHIVQVFKEFENSYGKFDEKLVDTLTNITALKIAMMSDKDIDKLIAKYN